MEYKEKINSYYREKSKQQATAKRKGVAPKIIPLDRIPYQDIRSRMQELKEVIQGLEELLKQYEMDVSYDLHDTLIEFDQVDHKLQTARAQYNELLSIKEKKEATAHEEYTKAQDALSRLMDTYRKTDDLEEKKDIYKQQHPFQQKILSRFSREMKVEGDEFRLFTLYRPVHEIKL
jgi:DNA repair exonuclease SbcCD ATPase subunit